MCHCLAEYFLEDSDLEGLSDITVSSVHTSDLSSFEEESEDEEPLSESSEEGELPADGLNLFFPACQTKFQQLLYHKVLNTVAATTDI